MAVSPLQSSGMRSALSTSCSRRPRAVQRPATHFRTVQQVPLRKFAGSSVAVSPMQLLQQQRGVACQGLFGLGLPEIAVIAGVAALIFGPSKLPELGKGLGKTVKSFQTAAQEFKTELEQAAAADDEPAAPGAAAKQQEAEKASKKE